MQAVAESARLLILSDEGLHHLVSAKVYPAEDFMQYFFDAPDDLMPTVVESIFTAMSGLASGGFDFGLRPWDFVNSAQEILAEERAPARKGLHLCAARRAGAQGTGNGSLRGARRAHAPLLPQPRPCTSPGLHVVVWTDSRRGKARDNARQRRTRASGRRG
jgi:hypothetical protein